MLSLIQNKFLEVAFTKLIGLVPLLLVATKLAFPSLQWHLVWTVTPFLSWIVCFAKISVYAHDMGFGDMLLLMFGWLVMLPVLAICIPLHTVFIRWKGSVGAKLVALALLVWTIEIPISASHRWIPESKLREIAETILREEGRPEITITRLEKTSEGWIAYQPNGGMRFSKSGDLLNGWNDTVVTVQTIDPQDEQTKRREERRRKREEARE